MASHYCLVNLDVGQIEGNFFWSICILLFIGSSSESVSSLAQLHKSDQLFHEIFSVGSAMFQRVVRQAKAFHSVLRRMQGKH